MKSTRTRKQKGLAAVTTVMAFPLLFGVFALSVESSRYLQTHARMGDATEMASLAIAANSIQNDSDNKRLAMKYAQVFLPDGDIGLADVRIEKRTCRDIYQARCGVAGIYDKDGQVFVEYKLMLKSDFLTWFVGDDFAPGYAQNIEMQGKAVARKYQGLTVDVAFVADFSGSMQGVWQGERKFDGVINVIDRITSDLENFNNVLDQISSASRYRNKAAFVGYNTYTKQGSHYYTNVIYQPVNRPLKADYSKNIKHIDYAATIGVQLHQQQPRVVAGYDGGIARFDTLPLTSDFAAMRNTIATYFPNTGTASYEGILAAANIVDNGANPRKLIIVLSDGADWKPEEPNNTGLPNYAARRLYNGGLCQNLVTQMQSKQVENRNIEAKIVMIGFDYDVNTNPGLMVCVGQERVYSAQNYNDIYSKILELISEEVGHLYSRNYDQS